MNRYWIKFINDQIQWLLELPEKISNSKCQDCENVLGENWRCETCKASWPDLTPDELERLKQFDLSEAIGE